MAELLHAQMRVSTDNRALAWPRPSLCSQTTPTSKFSGRQKVLAAPFSTRTPDFSVPHTRAHPRDGGAIRQRPGGITRERRISEEAGKRPGTRTTRPDPTSWTRTWTLDLPQNFVPDYSERPVAGHEQCQLTAHMFQQPGLATYPRSAHLTPSRSLELTSLVEELLRIAVSSVKAQIPLTLHFNKLDGDSWAKDELTASAATTAGAAAARTHQPRPRLTQPTRKPPSNTDRHTQHTQTDAPRDEPTVAQRSTTESTQDESVSTCTGRTRRESTLSEPT